MDTMIIALQEALAHQEQEISQMSQELYAQQKEIAALRLQLGRLQAKLEVALADPGVIRSHDQEVPPPHY